MPDFTTRYHILERPDDVSIDRAAGLDGAPLARHGQNRTPAHSLAIDATGSSTERALFESLFISMKRKFSPRAPGRSRMQKQQALLLGLSSNLYLLKHRHLFARMSAEPSHVESSAPEHAPDRKRIPPRLTGRRSEQLSWAQ